MVELCCPFMRSRFSPNLATDQWKVTSCLALAFISRCFSLAGLSSLSVGDGSRFRNSSASSGVKSRTSEFTSL